MAVYKRGNTYWYEFWFNGERIQKSAKTKNARTARSIEAAYKTQLAKGEVDLGETRKPSPQLKDFAPDFMNAIKTRSEKFHTIKFYNDRLNRLLEYSPMASSKLSGIDESLIEKYVQHRIKSVGVVAVNRELATLRRLLRMAHEWKLVTRVPKFTMLPGENNREFVLSSSMEEIYLDACPQPLKDVALLMLDGGLRVGEAVGLQREDVHLDPMNGSRFGYIHIKRGKSKNSKRNVSLTPRVREMLADRLAGHNSSWVFPGDSEGDQPFLSTSLDHQHRRIRDRDDLGLSKDFVLHSLRHTMLTRLGEAGVDAFSIMRIAGHSSITISQRYVHPSSEALERAFDKLLEHTAQQLPAKVPTVVKMRSGGQSINAAE
jgi:integrase